MRKKTISISSKVKKSIPRSVRATTLAQAIDKHIESSRKEIGKTKEQVLRTIKQTVIAEMTCERIGSATFKQFFRIGWAHVQGLMRPMDAYRFVKTWREQHFSAHGMSSVSLDAIRPGNF